MRKIAFTLLTLLSLSVYGQKNTLLEQTFWRENPNLDKIKAEIANGNNPSAATANGLDVVVMAINAQAANESIQFLLTQPGNDVNKKTVYGRTYMFWAANRGNTQLMEYLISKGAKANIKDELGYTVLTYAASGGQANTKVYDLCIGQGADPKKERIRGGANALLLVAPYDKDFSLINYFITKGVDVKSVDSTGNTAFDYALRSASVPVLKALVAKGVKYSPSAMVTASIGSRAGSNTLEVYQYLETLKLNPKATSATGDNALHYVVRRAKQTDIISYFLAKGLDVNQANNDGITPFMNAASANTDVESINLLLPLVKNINQVNKKGTSALAMAVRRNTPEVVKLLVDKGADVKVIDAEGYNLAYYLVPSYNVQRPETFEAKLKILTEKGFDMAATQGNGNTLYHLVLVRNGIQLLKRIEEFKVDVNAKNKEGLAPLHKAAMTAKDDSIMKYLLSIGAKKDVTTDFKETAFDLAKENEYLTKQHISIDFLK
jgi:ankyrin repeat protein